MSCFKSILDTIGNTPLVRLQKLSPFGREIYAKVESFNPMGSVKDRMARAIIERAEESGELKPGQTVIEATSGNTGVGLAMVCAHKGYPLVITMPESASIERRKLMRFLGAKVVLTPADQKGTGMLNKAIELADEHGYYLCRQFENEANAEVHTRTTAREILDDFGEENIDCFVSGFGTGGTLLGVARALKAANPATRIVAAEPDNARILGSGIAQLRDANGQPASSHPNFRPHLMQGWAPDFISKLIEDAMREGLIDEVVPVDGEEALRLSRELAQREGIFAGTTSGATLAAARAVAERMEPGSKIVCMLPDTAERYMSTPLFDEISEDMNAAEIELSQSTAGYRFDIPPTPVAMEQPQADLPRALPLDDDAERFVSVTIAAEPVVMFALVWCEFSWAVRKLFSRMNIEFRSIDLDAVKYQEKDFGGKVRAVLRERLGTPTIPQVFIGGKHIGGCTELFDAMFDGSMQRALDACGVNYDADVEVNPYELLPAWVHPRKTA